MTQEELFGDHYAALYDLAYADKETNHEVDTILKLAEEYGVVPRRVLDLGCGTGRHADVLARRGMDVVGLDISEAMLAQAVRRPVPPVGSVEYRQGDIRYAELSSHFDLAVMFFAVLGYLHEDDEIVAALEQVRAALRPGGVLAADVWFSPAVREIGLTERVRTIDTPDGEVVRHSKGVQRPGTPIVDVTIAISRDGREVTREVHGMRHFDEPALRGLVEQAGLTYLDLRGFPAGDEPATAQSWSAVVLCRRPDDG